MARRWARLVGDGCLYQGACLVHSITFFPDSDADYCDVYDGIDKDSGKKFARYELSTSTTRNYNYGAGVPFDFGVYVDGYDSAVETTVVFTPV